MSNRPVILIDMDECIVDMIGLWLDRYNTDWDDDLTPEDIKSWDIREYVKPAARDAVMQILREPGFFRNLRARPGAIEAIREIVDMGWDVRIASMPSGADSARCKVEWIEEHLGAVIPETSIILGADKAIYQADAIIDDRPVYIEQTRERMTTICMGTAYNTDTVADLGTSTDSATAWTQIVEFLRERIERMRAKTVVAFLARAGSGKTTAAQYIQDKYGAEVISFAGPIKNIARDVFGFTDKQLKGDLKEVTDPRYGISPRWFMQRLGCGARDHIDESIWLDTAMNAARKSQSRLVAIDDCRFINEARAVATDQSIDGYVVRIESDRSIDVGADASESEIDGVPSEFIHRSIQNGRSVGLPELYAQLDEVMDGLDVEPIS